MIGRDDHLADRDPATWRADVITHEISQARDLTGALSTLGSWSALDEALQHLDRRDIERVAACAVSLLVQAAHLTRAVTNGGTVDDGDDAFLAWMLGPPDAEPLPV
jgi:hypothetical protein